MRLNAPSLLVGLCLVSSVALAQTAPPPGSAYGTPAPAPGTPGASTPAYAPAPPPAQPLDEPSLVRLYTVGPRFSIAPGVFIPSSGSAGFSLNLVFGYGVDLGPIIVTPGVMFQGNWSSDWSIYSGLLGARVTVPIGNFGPFVEAGAGYGHLNGPLGYSSDGVSIQVGGGFIYFFSPKLAIGVAVDYYTITSTGWSSWTFAPTLMIHF